VFAERRIRQLAGDLGVEQFICSYANHEDINRRFYLFRIF
jgi:hypothetical protein